MLTALCQIERRVAPFWRGLQDFDDTWAEHQIIAAARGLPIPAADETPPEGLIPKPLAAESPHALTQNLNNLTVPMGSRTLSASSEDKGSGPNTTSTTSTLASPIAAPIRGSSPFKPRAKALAAALSVGSRNGSTTEIAPREITLPSDPFVNGQPLEVFLYKDATECPICFLSYPPYLNHTRCCDQAICSECFVQIKRADPHYPEGHGDSNNPGTPDNPEEQAGLLISEPACCPYCQQPEFGVTYDPPPFRRGLTYSINASGFGVGALGTAMSSSSSLNSTLSPSSFTPPASLPAGAAAGSRRRTQSLSANAAGVISTDRIRPDWSTKLATQRAHIARRAAAATALHTAAFLMGNAESRPFRVGRFSRRNTGSGVGNEAEASVAAGPAETGEASSSTMEPGARSSSGRSLLGGAPNNRRSRMEDLEELMFREALRQSLATEEERRRKSEKEERKEAKKKEKEERKAAKAAQKQGSSSGPYAGNASGSASGSSLSLSGIGRRRGNSGTSNLRMEASVASATAVGGSSSNGDGPAPSPNDKGKGVDRGPGPVEGTTADAQAIPSPASAPRPIATPHQPTAPSHLRQLSSASSISSSLPDSGPGSYQNPGLLQDPRASGLSLGSRSAASEDGEAHGDDQDPSANAEPMFNFRSLAEMVGVQLEGEHAGRRLSAIGRDSLTGEADFPASQATAVGEAEGGAAAGEGTKLGGGDDSALLKVERVENAEGSTSESGGGATLNTSIATLTPPEVTVTPETPAPVEEDGEEAKRLGYGGTTVEHSHQVTQ